MITIKIRGCEEFAGHSAGLDHYRRFPGVRSEDPRAQALIDEAGLDEVDLADTNLRKRIDNLVDAVKGIDSMVRIGGKFAERLGFRFWQLI